MMIEVKQLLFLLIYTLFFCICGSFMKRNYRIFIKMRGNSVDRETIALNIIVYFTLCIRLLIRAVEVVVIGVK